MWRTKESPRELRGFYSGEYEDNFDPELEFTVDLCFHDRVLPCLDLSSEDPAMDS